MSRDRAWRLGPDDQVTEGDKCQTEIRNFIEAMAVPRRNERR